MHKLNVIVYLEVWPEINFAAHLAHHVADATIFDISIHGQIHLILVTVNICEQVQQERLHSFPVRGTQHH